MNWYKMISYLINAVIAVILFQSIYDKLTDVTKLESWGLAGVTFLGIYYSCKTAIDESNNK